MIGRIFAIFHLHVVTNSFVTTAPQRATEFVTTWYMQSPPRESNSPPLDYESSARPSELHGHFDCGLPNSVCGLPVASSAIRNHQSAILHGPRGSRTHYPSIKSRELILM